MELSYLVLLSVVLAAAVAEVAVFKKCTKSSGNMCAVSQVRIDPCSNPKSCVFRKGTNVTLSFDFTPSFAATKLKTTVFWDNGFSDIPFASMGSDDGCEYTQCPTQAGTTQTLNYGMHVDKLLPKGNYNIKWKVWNEEDDSQLCCFKTNIEIKKMNRN